MSSFWCSMMMLYTVFFELDKPDPRWTVYERIDEDSMRVYFTHDSEPDDQPGVFNF